MNSALHSILRIAGSSAIGQMFLILATIVSAKIFEPEHLGALGLITTLAALGEVILGGRLDLALPVAGNDEEFSQLSHLLETVTKSCIFVGFMAASVVYLTSMAFDHILTPAQTAMVLVLLASAIALRFDARIQMAIRNMKFSIVGDAQAVSGFVQAAVLVIGGLVAPTTLMAVASFFVGRMVSLLLVLRKAVPATPLSTINTHTAIRRYPNFPKFAMPTAFVNSLIVALPVTFLAARFDVATAGVAFVVWRVLVSPTQLLGRSVGQVVYGKTAAMNNIAAIQSGVKRSLKGSVLACMAVGFSAWILTFVDYGNLFGDKWALAGDLIAPIGIVAAAQLAVSPLRNVFTRLGLQKRLLILQLIRLAFCGAAFGLSLMLDFEVDTTLWSFAVAIVFANILLAILTLSDLDRLSDDHSFQINIQS